MPLNRSQQLPAPFKHLNTANKDCCCWPITSLHNWPIRPITGVKYHPLTWYKSLWFCRWLPHYQTGSRNVSHCQQEQSYSGLRSPGRYTQPTYEMTPVGFKPFKPVSSVLRCTLNFIRLLRVVITPSVTEGVTTTWSNRMKFRLLKLNIF